MQLQAPYLIFLGAVKEPAYAKTAYGLVQWAPDKCLGQLRMNHCEIDLGIADMSIEQAVQSGAKTLVLGIAPVGGGIEKSWLPSLRRAIAAGMDIVSGLHSRLNTITELRNAAAKSGSKLIDVRVPPAGLQPGTGQKRPGKRLLTVGTDCSVGKKYAALTLAHALNARGREADFRATGQTGIMIAGEGIPIDAVVSDFVAGAAEALSPANKPYHWDVIEGQGSLFHPAYAGVSLGLLHGSQPDALVVCHDPGRQHVVGIGQLPLPELNNCIQLNLKMATLTNKNVHCAGICINSSTLDQAKRADYLKSVSAETGLPCVDPLIDGVDAIVDQLLTRESVEMTS